MTMPQGTVPDLNNCKQTYDVYEVVCVDATEAETTEASLAEASCCTTWNAECYTTASIANNNHACKDCGWAIEHCDHVCSSGSYKSGDLADSTACQECCQGYDHEVAWNCPVAETTEIETTEAQTTEAETTEAQTTEAETTE